MDCLVKITSSSGLDNINRQAAQSILEDFHLKCQPGIGKLV